MRFVEGRRPGARQSVLMGPGTKGGLRSFSATASSLWGKAIDGLRAAAALESASFRARGASRKGHKSN
jgi:hypothetical protein